MQYPSENLPSQEPKLLDQVRAKIRLKHYSIRTEQAYTDWIKRFILHLAVSSDFPNPKDSTSIKITPRVIAESAILKAGQCQVR